MSEPDLRLLQKTMGEFVARIERQSEALKSGSGDGTSGGMEARVAKLEAHIEHIRSELSKLSNVPTDLAILKTRVDHLPSKGFIVTSAATTIGAIVGLMTLLGKLGVLAGS